MPAFADFAPDSISGLHIWLKKDSGYVVEDGQIKIWKNAVSDDYPAVQNDARRRPQVMYETYPGHTTVGYDGKDDYFEIEGSENIDIAKGFSVFYVGKATKMSAVAASVGDFLPGDDQTKGWRLGVMKTYNNVLHAGVGSRESLSMGENGKSYFASGAVCKGARVTAYNSNLLEEKKLSLPAPIIPSGKPFLMNALYAKGARTKVASGGEACELLFFDRAITEEEASMVWDYLLGKFPETRALSGLAVASFSPESVEAPTDARIQMEFSKALAPEAADSIEVRMNGVDGAEANGKWSTKDGCQLIFTPKTPWPKGSLVVVKIPMDLESRDGTAYSSDRHVFSFIVDDGVDNGVKKIVIPTIKKTNSGIHNIPLALVLPERGGPFPVVFWVHGGGWSGGTATESKASEGPFSEYFARHLGVATAGVAYRCKGSKGNFSQAMEDVLDAYKWVESHAAEYNIDIERSAFAGGSAGTPLSALAAQRAPGATCYIGLNGIYNFVENPASRFGKGDSYGLRIPSAKANSAIFNLKIPPPDTILLHGTEDTTISPQLSVLFGEAIERAGGNARVVLYEGEPHAFFNPGKQMYVPVLYEVKEHLRRVFRL